MGLFASLANLTRRADPAPRRRSLDAATGGRRAAGMGVSQGAPAETASASIVRQRARYAARRDVLLPAVRAAGFTVEHSEAGLYLWCTRGEPCWDTVGALADVGVLAAAGEFYGTAGARHVRLALTASDAQVRTAAERLASLAA